MKNNKIIFRQENTLQVFRKGITSNKKIASKNEKIIQTYTFSKEQFNYVKNHLNNETKPNFKEFFTLDFANCSDCPFSGNQRKNDNSLTIGCYTHKLFQYSGFISMLKSIAKNYDSFEDIEIFNDTLIPIISGMANNLFVRFGSYGEPTKHPIELVKAIAKNSKNWTGYTHQYFSNIDKEYRLYFMASNHNERQVKTAKENFGYRSFVSSKDNESINAVICPASDEGGNSTNCSTCGLCSGIFGKGSKDIKIILH